MVPLSEAKPGELWIQTWRNGDGTDGKHYLLVLKDIGDKLEFLYLGDNASCKVSYYKQSMNLFSNAVKIEEYVELKNL